MRNYAAEIFLGVTLLALWFPVFFKPHAAYVTTAILGSLLLGFLLRTLRAADLRRNVPCCLSKNSSLS